MGNKPISFKDKDGNFVSAADVWNPKKLEELFTRLNPNRKLRLERERLARKEAAKHPELNDLYNKIYTKKDMSYWEGLDKKVQEYADKNGLMYVIDEEPFFKNPTGKPIIINYFYHEKIRQLSKNK